MRYRGKIRSFFGRERGGVTVEFVLWVPVFFSLVLLSADASLLFLRQSNFWTVSRDTARIVARHGMAAEAAETWAAENARIGEYRPDVAVRIDPVRDTVTVTISGKAAAMAPLGMMRFALGDRVSAAVTQVREPI